MGLLKLFKDDWNRIKGEAKKGKQDIDEGNYGDWEQCPRCESKKVKTTGKAFWVIVMIASGSVLFWLGFILFPFLVIGPLLVLASPLGLLMPKQNTCNECKYSWKVKKEKASA